MCKTRRSYGIICIRKRDELELLMIKRAITYCYSSFINGNYNALNTQRMIKLFSGMSHAEKTVISSMNFEAMWYMMYHENPIGYTDFDWRPFYEKKFNKFRKSFTAERMRFLIENSTTIDTPWEFPRGRQQENENKQFTAIREFCEETGVKGDQFRVLWHAKPYVHSYVDDCVRYVITYYFALAYDNCRPSYSFANKHQRSEVSAINWMTLRNMQNSVHDKQSVKQYKNMFKMAALNYAHPGTICCVSY